MEAGGGAGTGASPESTSQKGEDAGEEERARLEAGVMGGQCIIINFINL